MIKGKLSGANQFDDCIYVRIRIDERTRKRYMQFRQKLSDNFKIRKFGRESFSKLTGKYIDINVFREEKYMHLVIYGRNRKKAFGLLSENFSFYSEPKK